MELQEIRELVDDADISTSVSREEASDMLVFARISQWDDDVAADVQTQFRGTFDAIKPKRNRILKDLYSNPVSITFKAKDGADPEAAETLTGMFRSDMQRSEEALETAVMDQVDCGFGAFRFTTEYESKFDDLNNFQRINMEPISEANNLVYFDSNAKRKDKSDARWCAIVTTYTTKGWERFCEENDINYADNEQPAPFKTPHRSDSWFWRSKSDEIKVAEFYHKEKKRERIFIYEDPLGQTKAYYQKEIAQIQEELLGAGFVKVGEKYKERWIVHKYVVTGDKILKKTRIAGEHIPVVPVYGDWSRVEGRELWRGIYHDAQDAQRLTNFGLSYFADTVAQGPREKPVFYDGQIQGKEFYWHQSGANDNYPYRLVNEVSPLTGQPYPNQPIGYLKPPEVPQNVIGLIAAMRQSIEDVTGGQTDPAQLLNAGVTEGQIKVAMRGLENEAYLYQNSLVVAMKQAGKIYASMAAELYDVPREVTVQQPDGSESEVMVKEIVTDMETGEEITLRDITQGKFDVYSSAGPSFQSQQDEARATLQELYRDTAGTPLGQIVLMTYFTLLDGPKTDHLREYARKQLVLQGIIEPENEQEEQMLQQANQQSQQPDPAMLMAMAEMEKAKADQLAIQADAQDHNAQRQIDAYNAETKRLEAVAKTQKLRAETLKTGYEIRGTELDNLQKALMPRALRSA